MSGAVLSLPTEVFASVDGFDEGYFLYYEDADLFWRLAQESPNLRMRVVDVPAAVHDVGGSSPSSRTARLRRQSAQRYAASAGDGLGGSRPR